MLFCPRPAVLLRYVCAQNYLCWRDNNDASLMVELFNADVPACFLRKLIPQNIYKIISLPLTPYGMQRICIVP